MIKKVVRKRHTQIWLPGIKKVAAWGLPQTHLLNLRGVSYLPHPRLCPMDHNIAAARLPCGGHSRWRYSLDGNRPACRTQHSGSCLADTQRGSPHSAMADALLQNSVGPAALRDENVERRLFGRRPRDRGEVHAHLLGYVAQLSLESEIKKVP